MLRALGANPFPLSLGVAGTSRAGGFVACAVGQTGRLLWLWLALGAQALDEFVVCLPVAAATVAADALLVSRRDVA